MSNLEQYQVNLKTPIPSGSPTQLLLTVVPKPGTVTHTPVGMITIQKGIPAGGSNRTGIEDPKDVAATIYLNNTDFTKAVGKALTFVNYLSTDVSGQPIETITNFNF